MVFPMLSPCLLASGAWTHRNCFLSSLITAPVLRSLWGHSTLSTTLLLPVPFSAKFESIYENTSIFLSSFYTHYKTEGTGLMKLLEKKIYSLANDANSIGDRDMGSDLALLHSTQKFYDPYNFHLCCSLDLTLLLSCGCSILILMVQRLAFVLSFRKTSSCICFWRYTIKTQTLKPKGLEICMGSYVSTEEWHLISLGDDTW